MQFAVGVVYPIVDSYFVDARIYELVPVSEPVERQGRHLERSPFHPRTHMLLNREKSRVSLICVFTDVVSPTATTRESPHSHSESRQTTNGQKKPILFIIIFTKDISTVFLDDPSVPGPVEQSRSLTSPGIFP